MSFQSLGFSLQKHFEWVTVIFPVENNQKLRCAPFYFRTHIKGKSTVLAWFMCSCSAFHSVPSGKLPIQHFRDGSTCERTTRNHVRVVSSDIFVCCKQRYYIYNIIYIYIYIYIWATVNIWYIAPSHQFLKTVLSFFRLWESMCCFRFLKSVLSFSKPQFNFQKIKMSRIP